MNLLQTRLQHMASRLQAIFIENCVLLQFREQIFQMSVRWLHFHGWMKKHDDICFILYNNVQHCICFTNFTYHAAFCPVRGIEMSADWPCPTCLHISHQCCTLYRLYLRRLCRSLTCGLVDPSLLRSSCQVTLVKIIISCCSHMNVCQC